MHYNIKLGPIAVSKLKANWEIYTPVNSTQFLKAKESKMSKLKLPSACLKNKSYQSEIVK